MRSRFVERLVGTACRVALRISLGQCPGPAGSIQRDGGPAAAVFIADVDQQGVVVVLDPEPMPGIALLVELSSRPSRRRGVSNEGRPASTAGLRAPDGAAAAIGHRYILIAGQLSALRSSRNGVPL